MNVEEFISQFRNYMSDTQKPYLWSDEEIVLYLNEAEREAARRSRSFIDSSTPEVCMIDAIPGVQSYELDPRVIYIRRVRTSAHTDPVSPIHLQLIDKVDDRWETAQGRVENYVVGHESGKISLVRIPKVAQTIRMTVVREPLCEMQTLSDEPELPKRYHMQLLEYVYYRAYMKHDSEAENTQLAQSHYAIFEAEFGSKHLASSLEEEWAMSHGSNIDDGRF